MEDTGDTKNQLGKRYRCEVCGLELLCVVGGTGNFTCHNVAMVILQQKKLPSSD